MASEVIFMRKDPSAAEKKSGDGAPKLSKF
jgi:hypothetical protein